MYAIRYHETGDPDVLRWEVVEVPSPGNHEVLLKNTAIGVGLKETGERKGIYPCPPLPTIPGITAAAEILETGTEVTNLKPGDRVAYAGMPAGSYGEQRVMPADIFEVVLSGAVKATISEQYPLKDAAEAHRALESRRSTGSVILIP